MAITSYKKLRFKFANRFINADWGARMAVFNIFDDNSKHVGLVYLDLENAVDPSTRMGKLGEVRTPEPHQMIDRLQLDSPRTEEQTNRYVKFNK